MAEDTALHLLSAEFKLWSVKPAVNNLNSGHIELSWHASPDKPGRRYIIPKTSGDHRGWLNARSKIRQLFRQDGLSPLAPEKPEPALRKALALPQAAEKAPDPIKVLRAEIAELVDLVLELADTVKLVRDDIEARRAAPPPMPALPPNPRVRSIKAIDYLSTSWNSTDALARDMGLAPAIAYRKLRYLFKQGMIEMAGGGRWRRKPEQTKVVPLNGKTMKVRPLTNGHATRLLRAGRPRLGN